jgi:glycosyltransferase involved in cell wall biosynthesis
MDLRPALDGFSGVPQETRLLHRSLGRLSGVALTGLVQSGNRLLDAGADKRGQDRRWDQLQGGALRPMAAATAWPRAMGTVALHTLAGAPLPLQPMKVDPAQDRVWHLLFAKTLADADRDAVCAGAFTALRWPRQAVHGLGIATGLLGHAVYPRVATNGFDVMIAETPWPGRVAPGTQLLVRYHDAMPVFWKHTVRHGAVHRAMHVHALRRNAADGAWFVCGSEAARADLLKLHPEVAERSLSIGDMISHHFHAEPRPADGVADVLRKHRHATEPRAWREAADRSLAGPQPPPYLLMVATLEPRKNHVAAAAALTRLRNQGKPLHLVCVGSLGWQHEGILGALAPGRAEGVVHLLERVPPGDLRLLYRHAALTVAPSLAEGFDYCGVEAMRCGGVVLASDMAVHREVYGDASAYFKSGSSEDLAASAGALLAESGAGRMAALRSAGAVQSERYTPDVLGAQWQALLQRLPLPSASSRKRL